MRVRYGSAGDMVEVDQIDEAGWQQVLRRFDDSHLLQTWEYGRVRWGEKRLSHVVVRRNGCIVSAAQVRLIPIPPTRRGIAYVSHGPFWKVRGEERDPSYFRAGLEALIEEYALSRGFFLRIRPWGFEELDGGMKSDLIKAGLRPTRGIYRATRHTILVDLSPGEEDLRRRLKKTWRRSLAKAESGSLEIDEGFDANLFPPFISVYREMLDLKRFKPGSDAGQFSRIQEQLNPESRMRVTLAREGGTTVAGSICAPCGDGVVGLMAATGVRGRQLLAYYLLQWDEILWSQKKGARWYDLGGINREVNPGVYHFKSGLGGRQVEYLGVWDLCENRLLDRAVDGLEHLLLLRNRFRSPIPLTARP